MAKAALTDNSRSWGLRLHHADLGAANGFAKRRETCVNVVDKPRRLGVDAMPFGFEQSEALPPDRSGRPGCSGEKYTLQKR